MQSIKFSQALQQGTSLAMERDPSVFIMGLGVPDPKGIFGTTLDLHKKFGNDRAMDMPTAENGMTGVAIGTALMGMRPIMTHQRVEFALLALDQIFNQAAKWHYMTAGQLKVPLVIRLIIGKGWGQGPQHSQSLETLFAHIPGLKVVMPTTPYDAKGMLISSIEDNNPVIFMEHRWLHNTIGDVPEEYYKVPIGKARIAREGKDVTIVSYSYMLLEALKAAEILEKYGVDAEVVDLRSLRPLDSDTILASVSKTGKLFVADNGWTKFGVSAEIISLVTENIFSSLTCAPRRIGIINNPIPSTPGLAKYCYPRYTKIAEEILYMMRISNGKMDAYADTSIPLDIPDKSFTGPF